MHRLLAQITNPVLKGSLGTGSVDTGGTTVGKLIGTLVGAMFIFSFVLAFFFLLTGGISWITSSGDKAQLQAARDKIINALIGLIIVGAAWAVFKLVGGFLGIQFPNLTLPTLQ